LFLCTLSCAQVLVALVVHSPLSLPPRELVVLVVAATTPPLLLAMEVVWASGVQDPLAPLALLTALGARVAAMPWTPPHLLLALEAVLVA
jgi:hypothetical protein